MIKIMNVTLYFNLEVDGDYIKYVECIKELNKQGIDFDVTIIGDMYMIAYKKKEF